MNVKSTINGMFKLLGKSFKRAFIDTPSRLASRFDGNVSRVVLQDSIMDYLSVWGWSTGIGILFVGLAPLASFFYAAVCIGLVLEIAANGTTTVRETPETAEAA
jgi:hypothetical protein